MGAKKTNRKRRRAVRKQRRQLIVGNISLIGVSALHSFIRKSTAVTALQPRKIRAASNAAPQVGENQARPITASRSFHECGVLRIRTVLRSSCGNGRRRNHHISRINGHKQHPNGSCFIFIGFQPISPAYFATQAKSSVRNSVAARCGGAQRRVRFSFAAMSGKYLSKPSLRAMRRTRPLGRFSDQLPGILQSS